eukprot:jgi/Undpi1/8014/HiC_scaffold_24.g10486.m1
MGGAVTTPSIESPTLQPRPDNVGRSSLPLSVAETSYQAPETPGGGGAATPAAQAQQPQSEQRGAQAAQATQASLVDTAVASSAGTLALRQAPPDIVGLPLLSAAREESRQGEENAVEGASSTPSAEALGRPTVQAIVTAVVELPVPPSAGTPTLQQVPAALDRSSLMRVVSDVAENRVEAAVGGAVTIPSGAALMREASLPLFEQPQSGSRAVPASLDTAFVLSSGPPTQQQVPLDAGGSPLPRSSAAVPEHEGAAAVGRTVPPDVGRSELLLSPAVVSDEAGAAAAGGTVTAQSAAAPTREVSPPRSSEPQSAAAPTREVSPPRSSEPQSGKSSVQAVLTAVVGPPITPSSGDHAISEGRTGQSLSAGASAEVNGSAADATDANSSEQDISDIVVSPLRTRSGRANTHNEQAGSSGSTGPARSGKASGTSQKRGGRKGRKTKGKGPSSPDNGATKREDVVTSSNALVTIPKYRGLRNMGNTCFLSAAVQIMRKMPITHQKLLEFPGGDTPTKGKEMTWAMSKTIKALQSEDEAGALEPTYLVDTFFEKFEVFKRGDQEDTSLALVAILQKLDEETLDEQASLNRANDEYRGMRRYLAQTSRTGASIVDTTRWTMSVTRRCQGKDSKGEPCMVKNQITYSKKNRTSTVESITRVPKEMCLTVGRFGDDGLRSNAKIVLDNTLNNKEVFGGRAAGKSKLAAVGSHIPLTMSSGHWVASHSIDGSRWKLFNDACVSDMSSSSLNPRTTTVALYVQR